MSSIYPDISRIVDEKLKYLSQRHQVLASNLANVDTPGYRAKDVQAPDFRKLLAASVGALPVARTHSAHLAGTPIAATDYRTVTRATTDELNPNGNNVSAEEEMQKIAVNASDYQLTLGIEQGMDRLFNIALGQQTGSK